MLIKTLIHTARFINACAKIMADFCTPAPSRQMETMEELWDKRQRKELVTEENSPKLHAAVKESAQQTSAYNEATSWIPHFAKGCR